MNQPISERSAILEPRPTSRRLELLITVLGLLSLVLCVAFYDRTFPSAALDLSLSSAEIKQRALAYLQARGYDLENYKSAVTFSGSGWSSYYLQRTLGIPETNRLIQEADLPIWYWHARWFRPLQKEEFDVYLSPAGQVVGLSHTVLEDAPGASLPQDEARTVAERYLTEGLGWNLANWEEVSASSRDRPGGRTDHSFSWKRRDWDVGESQLRVSVKVQGAEIGYYDYWIKVPEDFQRDFSEKQNLAGFVDGLSSLAGLILSVGVILLAFCAARWYVPRSFKRAFWPALAVAGITAASELNDLALANAWYGTTEDYRLFWLNQFSYIAFAAFANGLSVFVLWFAGHWLSQRVWPHRDRILDRRGHRRAHLARSGWRGLMLGLMSGGYLVLFYLVATQLLGNWIPMSTSYTYAYATPLPFLGALEVGLVPAMTEELLFRLILISGVLWLTRTFTNLPENACRLLALLIPAALWGFAHTTYVRDPFYLRGVELTLSALLLEGLFFLRFDLTTTIVAHFAYNAGLGALPLLRSGEPYFVISGLVVILAMLAPTLPYLLWALRRRLGADVKVPSRPRIRALVVDDAAALATLPVDEAWADLLADPDTVVLGLEAGDEIVGVAVGRILTATEAEVSAVYVAPDWRRRYWGSEMLTELREELHARGIQRISTQVDVKDKEALSFMTSQPPWQRTRVTFAWPSPPLKFKGLSSLFGKLRLRRRSGQTEREAPTSGKPPQ